MKAGQFETCFIIQTYNRLSRSLSHRGAIVHTRLPEISVRFLRLSRRRNFNLGGQRRHACYFRGRCNNDSMWKFNHLNRVAMIYKIHDNIKTGGRGKKNSSMDVLFFRKSNFKRLPSSCILYFITGHIVLSFDRKAGKFEISPFESMN